MNGLSIRNALGPVVFLVGAVGFVALALGLCKCTPAEANAMKLTAENAAAVAQYDLALVECQQAARQKPKELRFEAYTDCEQAVSKHFCSESKELRMGWERCSELGFAKE